MPPTKTKQLIGHMRAGRWDRALSLAATFRRLGEHRATIVRGHEARVHPAFYRQLGLDPEAAIAAAVDALRQLYPERGDAG
jgi:hypothetical protein